MVLYDALLNNLHNEISAKILYYIIISVILLFVCSIVNFITKRVLLNYLAKFVRSNNFKWDDIMLENKVFHKLSHLIPGMLIFSFAEFYNEFDYILRKIAVIYILITISMIFKSILESIDSIYRQNPLSKERPIKGLLQIIEIAIYIMIGIAIISILINQNPIYLLSGVGAVTAVVTLIFKDIIIGFVSGIQLSWNDMLRIGDWVEMPKYNADGDVLDISLYSVKIQNWDKTISTIPTSAFITDSFKNWRGMREFGARRVKRSVLIDMNTVKICSDEMIERFKKIEFIKQYIEEKSREIEHYNKDNLVNTDYYINGRHLTNLGVFRVYITNYIKNRINILQGSTVMVRQLAPGENGIPIELYLFVADTIWANYESIQADIFDHILAVVDVFELKIFQHPTGNDIKQLMLK